LLLEYQAGSLGQAEELPKIFVAVVRGADELEDEGEGYILLSLASIFKPLVLLLLRNNLKFLMGQAQVGHVLRRLQFGQQKMRSI